MTVIQAPSRNLATRTTRRVTPVAKAPKPLMSMRWRRPGESEERLSGGPVEAHRDLKLPSRPFGLYPVTNRRVRHICLVLADVGFRRPPLKPVEGY